MINRIQKTSNIVQCPFNIISHLFSARTKDICQSGLFEDLYEADYPPSWECDGIQDCDTAVDEQGCNRTNTTAEAYYNNSSATATTPL